MKRNGLTFAGLLLIGAMAAAERGSTQTSPADLSRIYSLVKGSQLTDECPVCDRVPIVVPMTGTFRLKFLNQGPLFSYYELQSISFQAGSTSGPLYQVTGSGTFQIGGELAVIQDCYLDVVINNGFTNTEALCVNTDRTVSVTLPEFQVAADQTNGTFVQVYHLKLAATPAPLQFLSITPDRQSGNLQLTWDAGGSTVQVERASNAGGPYSPLGSPTSDSSFVDVGVLTNQSQYFYRLRQ